MVYIVRYLHNKSYLTVRFSSVYRHESVRIQVCTYVYTHAHPCTHVRITHMHAHPYTHVRIHTRMHIHTHMHTRTYTCTYLHVYTHMHSIHAQVYTYALPVHNNIYTQRYNYTFILAKLTRCISFRIKTLHYMII